MTIPFDKFQATGNDFIMVDQRTTQYLSKKDTDTIKKLCDRRFGIGADGLILLQLTDDADFEMIYFNADGRESTLCGNGGRSIVKFAQGIGLITDECEFLAVDGVHHAIINENGGVELQMNKVTEVNKYDDHYTLDTGSPHYITFYDDIKSVNVAEQGARIRYSDNFKKHGINVNFVQKNGTGIHVRTYERGVEDETLSCGTGVTAAAIAASLNYEDLPSGGAVNIRTIGGDLQVKFEKEGDTFKNIWLCGPAQKVFKGAAYI
ncbi:MAG: diaminopimelate epimerase [Saprospiraceae bacterium]|nr:diaminopimelate epimerase [Saprospiraceae bacterium]